MTKILQATSRGQVNLPKEWRKLFNTNYFKVEIKDTELVITPLITVNTLNEAVEESWEEYLKGKTISHEKVMKKYGL